MVKQWFLFAGDIYAIGSSSDSTVVVSVVEPRPYRIVNAWKIHNITVHEFVIQYTFVFKFGFVILLTLM